MFANCQTMGSDIAFPDVCLTPATPSPVPTTYPNTATGSAAVPSQFTTIICAGPAHNLGTTVPSTNGDEAGTATGVASGTVMGPSRHILGANTVLIGGMPVTRMTSSTLQNSTNASGCRLSPSQVTVIVLAP
jgi:hypothetical protein